MPLTQYGQRLYTLSLYGKGKSFIAAGVLLRQQGGYAYVVLHLLCQGIEICCKAFLLALDFKKYAGNTGKLYGHDLVKVVDDVLKAFPKLEALRPDIREELTNLNNLYKNHLLRYDSVSDILVDSKTIPNNLVFRRMAVALRVAEREFARQTL